MNVWTDGEIPNRRRLRQSYRDHYKHVRAVVPQDRLLEFQPQEGWKPLCRFLGKLIPEHEPYPHINEAESLIKIQKRVWWLAMMKTIQKVGAPLVALGVLIGAIWYYRYKNS